MVQAYLGLTFAKSYTFGLMDFLNMIKILEQDQFYKDAFELTFQIDSKPDRFCMIEFWEYWLIDMDLSFLCSNFIKEKIQKFNMPFCYVADFFEQIE